MSDHLLPVTIFVVTLVGILAWERMRNRLSEEQLEALSGGPVVPFLACLLLLILIVAMALSIVNDLVW